MLYDSINVLQRVTEIIVKKNPFISIDKIFTTHYIKSNLEKQEIVQDFYEFFFSEIKFAIYTNLFDQQYCNVSSPISRFIWIVTTIRHVAA